SRSCASPILLLNQQPRSGVDRGGYSSALHETVAGGGCNRRFRYRRLHPAGSPQPCRGRYSSGLSPARREVRLLAGFVRFPTGKFEVARGVPFSKTFTFVAGLDRWLPEPPAFVSPDGTIYALSTGSSVQLVDSRTGRATPVATGAFNVVELTRDGLLLS